jgi:hypothetical protein
MEDKPEFPKFNNAPRRQAKLQNSVAGARPVDWHVAETGAVQFFQKRVKEVAPSFKVYHTPPRENWRIF